MGRLPLPALDDRSGDVDLNPCRPLGGTGSAIRDYKGITINIHLRGSYKSVKNTQSNDISIAQCITLFIACVFYSLLIIQQIKINNILVNLLLLFSI